MLLAFAESTVVVVAAELGHSPATLTVMVPSRALNLALPGAVEADGSPARTARRWRRPASWRWLYPGRWNWILPRALLQIDLLLPSAEADRQVQVTLPEGVALYPSQPRSARAGLEIKTRQPPPIWQLRQLVCQLVNASQWPTPLYQSLADLTRAKAAASLESLREHQVGAAPGEVALTATESSDATREYRNVLDEADRILGGISGEGETAALHSHLAAWQRPAVGWTRPCSGARRPRR